MVNVTAIITITIIIKINKAAATRLMASTSDTSTIELLTITNLLLTLPILHLILQLLTLDNHSDLT